MDETRLQSSGWLNTPISFSRAGSGPMDLMSGIAWYSHLVVAHGERVHSRRNASVMSMSMLYCHVAPI